ncbi:RNA-processing protein [Candidatus Micrarchaeota archaeon]|nr:RNA-processing protein [Candidatus Micrarchaeota archaeon]
MDLLIISKRTAKAMEEKNRSLLKDIEKKGEVKIKLEDGQLEIEGEGGTSWIAGQVVKAIDFGFLPQIAYKLFKDDFFLEVIDLEIILSNDKAIERLKGRIIGEQGRAKKTLQDLTGAWIAISGNKIAVLGEFENLQLAKEGVLRLLEGAPHTGVYAYLERRNSERKYNLK